MLYELLPNKLELYNANNVLKIAENIKEMSEPVLIIQGFITNSSQTNAFITAYKTGLPPTPPELFEQSLQKGNAQLIAPNILIGPNPIKTEFKKYLYPKGIRNILYIGNERLASAIYDKLVTSDANIKWYVSVVIDQEVIEMLKNGVPWYVYGISNEDLVTHVTQNLFLTCHAL